MLATLLVGSDPTPEPVAADHGGAHPEWTCDGVPILMRGGHFYEIVPDPATPGDLMLEEIPGTSGIWNSTAYDPTTDYIYGVGNIAEEKTVRAYDAAGDVVFNTTIQDPYPDDAGAYAGTVLGDGRYIIHSVGSSNGATGWYAGNRFNLWSIDPTTGAATHIGSTPRNLADISYNPLDGFVYHITNRTLYKVDPNTGAVTSTAMPGAFPGGNFGSSWFDAAGFLYVFRNNPGDIFRVDINDTSVWREVGEVGSDGGTDGTSCVSQVDLKKDVVDGAGDPVLIEDRNYAPGDTATYELTVINNGVPTVGLETRVCDTLPAPLTYTGTWTASDVSASLHSGGTAGDDEVCIDVDVASSLWTDPATPGQDPVVITLEVSVPASAPPGELANQATLDVGRDDTVDLLSDDPGDGSEPRDPTTLNITGGFSVAKTVVGHPDGPTTDSFTLTVSCSVGAAAHTVAPADIVDAATGDPWPGAVSGSFTMTDSEQVRIENVPAGAECTTTETVPAAYAVAPTSTDGTTTGAGATVVIDEPIADESVSFTNRTGVVTLTKDTSITSAYALDEDGTFTLDLTCDSGQTGSFEITTVGGTGTVTHPDTPLVPDGASCSVSETAPAGWETVGDNPATLTVSSAGPVTATITNTRRVADFTVNKTILGLPTGTDPTSFDFTVNVECTGPFDTGSYTVPGSPTISTDTPLVVSDLPVGAECTVTEDAFAGFTTTYSPAQTVTITEDGASVGVVNSTGSLIVVKETTTTSGLPVDLVETFDFDITCTLGATTVYDGTHSLTTDGLIADGGIGAIGWGELPLIPGGSSCMVTEVPTAGWTRIEPAATGSVDLTVTVENPEPTVMFVNQRDVDSFTVTKSIAGAPAEWSLGAVEFEVDVTCTGGFDPDPVVLAGLTVSVDTPMVVDGVPTGATCTAVETADNRFTTAYSPPTGAALVPDGGATVVITNTTSTLSLSKTTTATSPFSLTLDDTFTFDVECSNGASTIHDGTASITTSGGSGSAPVLDLPLVAPGSTCTVTEQGPPDGWTIADRTGGTPLGADRVEVTTVAGSNAVAFTNERDTETLTIAKDVTGIPVTPDVADDDFTVSVSCTGDFETSPVAVGPLTISEAGPATITGLPTGAACTAVETADSRFTTTYSPVGAVTVVESPAVGQNLITVVNTATTVSVTKNTTTGAGAAVDDTFTFDIECRDPADDTVLHTETFSITTSGGTGTWGGTDTPLLPIGIVCDVTEQTPPAGWVVVGDTTEQITTTDASTVNATFTNSRETADLTIEKTLLGIPIGLDYSTEPFSIDVSCTGPVSPDPLEFLNRTVTATTPLVIPDLPTGAVCTVTEDFDSRFQTLYTPLTGDGSSAVVTIETGGTSVGVTNAGGSVIVRKETTTDSDLPVDLLGDFEFEIDCGVVHTDTYTLEVDTLSGGVGIGILTYDQLPVLPNGTDCTITEAVPAGWTATTANPVAITVSSSAVATASFVNERDTAALTVAKTLAGVPVGVDLSAELFVVDVTCTGGFTTADHTLADQVVSGNADLVIDGVPTGSTCVVTEDADTRFATSYAPAGPGGATVDGAATVDADGETVTVTNTTSTLSITKATTGPTTHPLDLDDDFDFEVDCGGSVVPATVTTSSRTGTWVAGAAVLVPPGTSCTVTEQADEHWTNTGAASDTVVTDSASVVAATFENRRNTAGLSIGKTILGLPAGVDLAAEPFTVNVSCTGGFTSEPHAIGPFSVSADTPIEIDDLPVGADCTVTETADDRFSTIYDPDPTLTIESVGSSLDIVNATSSFTIDKSVVVDGTQPIDLSAVFTFDVECDNGADFTLTATSVDGAVAPVTYPDVPLQPDGTACTVTEQTPPVGWEIEGASTADLILRSDQDQTVSFVNRRQTDDLTISKQVLGAPTGLDPDTLTFTVDVTCNGDFDGPFAVANLAISTTAPATIDDLPVGATCSVIEDTDIRFNTLYSPSHPDGPSGLVTIADGGSALGVINLTGEIMVVKVAEAPVGHPIDLETDVEVEVSCGRYGVTYTATHTITTDTPLSATSATGFIRYDDLPAMPEGTFCVVSETAAPAGWTRTSASSVYLTVDSDATGASVPTATFVNRRDTGPLTVTKELVGVPDTMDLDAEAFTVDVTCTGGLVGGPYTIADQTISVDTPLTIENLPTGANCSVAEDVDPRFATAYAPASAAIDTDGETIAVTNTTSTVAINKAATSPTTHPIELADTFRWDVTCTNPDDVVLFDGEVELTTGAGSGSDPEAGIARWQAPAAPLMAPGSVCEIAEQPDTDWLLLSSRDQTVTTVAGVETTVDYVNQRRTATLDITKVIDGAPDDLDLDREDFDVDVTCTGDFVGGTTDLTGVVSIETPLAVDDLPTGAICQVTETADPRFATTYDPATGSIEVADGGGAVTVTNTTSVLVVVKSTVAASDHPVDLVGSFRFQVMCDDGHSGIYTVETDIETPDGMVGFLSWQETGLHPPGTVCTVTEIDVPDGWRLGSAPTVTATLDVLGEPARFENVRTTGSIEIGKVLAGLRDGVDLSAESFPLTVACTGDFVDGGHTIEDSVSAAADLVVEGLPTGAVCSVAEATDDRFTDAYEPTDATVTVADASVDPARVVITNTRRTGSLAVTKTLDGAPAAAADDEFTVDVTCTGDFAGGSLRLEGLTISAAVAAEVSDLPTNSRCSAVERPDNRFDPSYRSGRSTVTVVAGSTPTEIGLINTWNGSADVSGGTLAFSGASTGGLLLLAGLLLAFGALAVVMSRRWLRLRST